jgi:hypothetical protein
MLEEARASMPNWRDADLHGLRVRYAALLADIAWHRTLTNRGEGPEANGMLWETMDKEML